MSPTYHSLTVDRCTRVGMRDGTVLRADVYRPAVAGRYPTLLFRTPYGRTGAMSKYGPLTLRAASAGYAVVLQDVRGCGESEGALVPFVHEADDGADTLDWLCAQPWCDANVGMFGGSYDGVTQWQAARSGHPALKAIAPNVTSADYHHGWIYRGGALQLGFALHWAYGLAGGMAARSPGLDGGLRDELAAAFDSFGARVRRLPLTGHGALRAVAGFYHEWLAHPAYDEYWSRLDVSRDHHRLGVAALNLGGWYDPFLDGTIENFAGMRAHAPEPARDRQRLVVGPWPHEGLFAGGVVGGWHFARRGAGPAIDPDGLQLRWFDRWLRGAGTDDGAAPVTYFAMGADEWRAAEQWPLPGTDWQEWYLSSNGRANTLHGDGALHRDPPAAQPPDRFRYDPADPVPTLGGGLYGDPGCPAGVFDQRAVERRADVLVYTSEPVARPLEVTGPVRLILHAATDAPDTDWSAKLVDVEPSGYARNLADGIVRARYHRSREQAQPITPGEVAEYCIDLGATSNVFDAGHRIRVEVSSSNFPRFDRNLNTGEPCADGVAMRVAHQRVHHEPAHPSRLVLPVAAPDSSRKVTKP